MYYAIFSDDSAGVIGIGVGGWVFLKVQKIGYKYAVP
jgi:hypothetical protein